MGKTKYVVRGKMGDNALASAGRLFDQSLDTIVSEAFQNARRGGATRIDVTVEDRPEGLCCAIADDGSGVDDLSALVAFGRSGWDEGATPAEDWAGMGVFSMAARGCVVESLGQRIEVTPDVFAGRAVATPVTAPFRQGTRVTFPLPEDDRTFLRAVVGNGTFMPVPVWVNGKEMPQSRFPPGTTDMVVIENTEFSVRPVAPGQSPGESWWSGMVNFHGRLCLTGLGVIQAGTMEFDVGWSALEGSPLRMRLPTRDAVIRDDAWRRIREASLAWLSFNAYGRLAKLGLGSLMPREEIELARRHGYDIALPDIGLDGVEATFLGMESEKGPPPGRRRVVVPQHWQCSALHAAVLAAKAGAAIHLAFADKALKGDPAYDALASLESVTLTMASGRRKPIECTKFERLERSCDDMRRPRGHEAAEDLFYAADRKAVPVRLEATLHLLEPDGSKTVDGPHRIPFAWYNPEGMDTETRILVDAEAMARPEPRQVDDVATEISRYAYDGEKHDEMRLDVPDWTYDEATHRKRIGWEVARRVLPEAEVDAIRVQMWLQQAKANLADQFPGIAFDRIAIRREGAGRGAFVLELEDGMGHTRTYALRPGKGEAPPTATRA